METNLVEAEGRRWFILQALNPVFDCPVLETRFAVANLFPIYELLGEIASKDPELLNGYLLDSGQFERLKREFGVSLGRGERSVWLGPLRWLRSVPYLVHTGYELFLMLEGRKPFAKFSDAYPNEWMNDTMARFAPFVAEGRITCRVIEEPWPQPRSTRGQAYEGMRWLYYTLPGQEWRIDAERMLWAQAERIGWNDTFERLEGHLLGYTDAQNDWWIEHRPSRQADRTDASRCATAGLAPPQITRPHTPRTPAATAAGSGCGR